MRRNRVTWRRRWLLAAGVAALAGCRRASLDDPGLLRFSGIPDQATQEVRGQHEALVDRVCAALQRRCRWVDAAGYDELVDMIGDAKVDIAFLGAVGFARAHARHGAVPLVMRDIDRHFASVVVVRKEADAMTLDDLRGHSFAFGNRSSTSGHVMLRARLEEHGLQPEVFFARIEYASNHDETLHAVAERRVDAGGVNASLFYRRVAAGQRDAVALRVLWQSPPFVDYVWAARAQLSEDLRDRVREAFLDLSRADDDDALRAQGGAGYLPAFHDDFEEVRRVLGARGLW